MIENLKAVVAVLILATVVISLGWRTALRFVPKVDLQRRTCCWYVLTIAGFASPSFWIYLTVAAPVMAWAAMKDSNPLGVYAFLLFVIPPLHIQIPTAGLLNLFYVDNARLMGFVILAPLVTRVMFDQARPTANGSWGVEAFLWAFGALQLAQLFPYESITNTMRRAFLLLLDVYLLYYAFSRGLNSKQRFDDTFASFCLAGAVLALLGAFESIRGWLLYTQIGNLWGASNEFSWLLRGDRLRAQVSTGHALSLGYILAISLGFWVYLKTEISSRGVKVATFLLLSTGIYFTFSRGPLLIAVLLVLTYSVLRQRELKRSIAGLVGLISMVVLFLWSPLGAGVLETLPFVGSHDQETVAYRQQLASVSWELIKRNPWLGDPFAMMNMEALRQGQGIIDLVNAYASVALFNGLLGLGLFVGAFVSGLKLAYSRSRMLDFDVPEQAATRRLGVVVVSAMIATLVFMGTAGNAWLQWQLLGMLVAYGATVAPAGSVAGSRQFPFELQRAVHA